MRTSQSGRADEADPKLNEARERAAPYGGGEMYEAAPKSSAEHKDAKGTALRKGIGARTLPPSRRCASRRIGALSD
jgi:hypothetical protein